MKDEKFRGFPPLRLAIYPCRIQSYALCSMRFAILGKGDPNEHAAAG
jgi:hypothetical protein